MKELSGTARNYCLAETSEGFIPQVEFIMVITEPQYRFTTGELIRERVPETWRLSMSRRSISQLILTLNEIDDELKLLEKQAAAATLCGEAKKSETKIAPDKKEEPNNPAVAGQSSPQALTTGSTSTVQAGDAEKVSKCPVCHKYLCICTR